MSKDAEPFNLPVGPNDLCFDTNEFAKQTFSVDKFLQNHSRKANLESMRDDLGIYLKVLRASMIELINKDYADFVNLSTNLIGLDKTINGIQVPLCQLKEEVLQVKSSLDEAIDDISARLDERHDLLSRKHSLQNLARVQSSLSKLNTLLQLDKMSESKMNLIGDPGLVERAASEYNQLKFSMSKCTMHLVKRHTELGEKIEELLTSSLDDMFLKSANSRDADGMARCLRVYITLDKIGKVEELFRYKLVAPAMGSIISESSLQSDPMGLRGVYSRILDFIKSRMSELLELTAAGATLPAIKGFDFLIQSFWPEVEQRLEMHLSSIYAPGNPEVFYQRYSETVEFLGKLERCCGTQTKVKVLQAHPQYSAFLQRWNLPVYFQIRFQEIAGTLENVVIENNLSVLSLNAEDVSGFHLIPTLTTWDCLMRCWADGVFVPQLAHRFWKLSLQIIARYSVWTLAALTEKWPSDTIQSNTTPSITAVGEAASTENKKLSFLVCLYLDIEKLITRLPELLDKASARMNSLSAQNKSLVAESLKESEQQLLTRLPNVTRSILDEVSSQSLVQLRQVSDIPRLFRRTNREIPTKPCGYVSLLLSPPTTFHITYKPTVESDVLQQWLTLIFTTITQQFYSSVDDVLTSVQKTEESLRRLKKIRDRSAASAPVESRGVGDDDKIRQQLAIDVISYCNGIESLGVRRSTVEKLDNLVSLVESARDKSNPNNK